MSEAEDQPADLRGSSSIDDFCMRHGMGRTLFYDLQKRGLAPRLMRLRAKVRISREAEIDWIRMMEERGDAEAEATLRRKARAAAAKSAASPFHVSKRQREEA